MTDQKGISGFSGTLTRRERFAGKWFPLPGSGKIQDPLGKEVYRDEVKKPSGRGSGFASEESELYLQSGDSL